MIERGAFDALRNRKIELIRGELRERKEELESFDDYERLAVYWRDEIANVRKHRTTGELPVERFEKEREKLRPLPLISYDTDEIVSAVVTPYARVRYGSNRYSVPSRYARRPVTLRVDGRSLRVLHDGVEIARHQLSFERSRLILDPEHRKDALQRRRRSQARQIEADFDALGEEARIFRLGLLRVPVKPIVHLRRIFSLLRLYGKAEVMAAISRAVEYEAFDAAYVMNLIDQERRKRQLASPIPLRPKRMELLEEIQLEEPDPGEYDRLSSLKEEDHVEEGEETSRGSQA